MNDFFDVKKPTFPSDYIWEKKLQTKKRFLTKAISLGFVFIVGFSFVAMGIYKMKNN